VASGSPARGSPHREACNAVCTARRHNMLALAMHAVVGTMQGLACVQELDERTSSPAAQPPLPAPEGGRSARGEEGPPLPGILGMASQVRVTQHRSSPRQTHC
jgi:hypothetical protein